MKIFLATYCNENKDLKPEHDSEIDPVHILASVIYKANAKNINEFVILTQLDVQEPKTYE